MKQTIWLPWPPTSNTMFGLKGHVRFISRKYQDWRDLAAEHIAAQRPIQFDCCVSFHADLTPPTKREWDLDNRLKPLLDVLVAHKVIVDDNTKVVVRISAAPAFDDKPGALVTLEAVA